jgi:hypothetical protein
MIRRSRSRGRFRVAVPRCKQRALPLAKCSAKRATASTVAGASGPPWTSALRVRSRRVSIRSASFRRTSGKRLVKLLDHLLGRRPVLRACRGELRRERKRRAAAHARRQRRQSRPAVCCCLLGGQVHAHRYRHPLRGVRPRALAASAPPTAEPSRIGRDRPSCSRAETSS